MNVFEIDKNIKLRKIEDICEPPSYVYVNSFDESSAKEFANSMNVVENKHQSIIPIIIDSYGGQVYSLLSMVDVIRNCKKPVATIVLGKAMSCGAVLFTMGTDGMRYMGPNATLMIHDVSSGARGKVEEVKVSAAETDRLNQQIFKMMARNCGQSDNYFLDILHEKGHAEWYLDPSEALKHKLTNHVRVPKFRTKVSLDVEFG